MAVAKVHSWAVLVSGGLVDLEVDIARGIEEVHQGLNPSVWGAGAREVLPKALIHPAELDWRVRAV